MKFPVHYRGLENYHFSRGKVCLTPIRYVDRLNIMQWRNEQMFHLRQQVQLTEENQTQYFQNVIRPLFEKDQPEQLLFSYLENDECIGYGGLVHINYIDKNAELSFLLKTDINIVDFKHHWKEFLNIASQVAILKGIHKIYTYAFDVRPHLYGILEEGGMKKEAILKEHCYFEKEWRDVVIHSIILEDLTIRSVNKSDSDIIFHWANNEETRSNSFQSHSITLDEHRVWFENKQNEPDAFLFMGESQGKPAGLVRFDKKGNEIVVGINMNPEFRNKKLSAMILWKALRELNPRFPVLAYIKSGNMASVRTFEKAGFIFDGETYIGNHKALIYKYALHVQ